MLEKQIVFEGGWEGNHFVLSVNVSELPMVHRTACAIIAK